MNIADTRTVKSPDGEGLRLVLDNDGNLVGLKPKGLDPETEWWKDYLKDNAGSPANIEPSSNPRAAQPWEGYYAPEQKAIDKLNEYIEDKGYFLEDGKNREIIDYKTIPAKTFGEVEYPENNKKNKKSNSDNPYYVSADYPTYDYAGTGDAMYLGNKDLPFRIKTWQVMGGPNVGQITHSEFVPNPNFQNKHKDKDVEISKDEGKYKIAIYGTPDETERERNNPLEKSSVKDRIRNIATYDGPKKDPDYVVVPSYAPSQYYENANAKAEAERLKRAADFETLLANTNRNNNYYSNFPGV
jgi:hypothetical protein